MCGEYRPMNQANPIRVGVVGLGRSGHSIHLKALPKLPEHYQLVAVADTWQERVEAVATEFGVVAHNSIEALLADDTLGIELVTVAVPNYLHAPYSIAALNAGKHVVCEKPFGLTASDVDAMIAAGQAANKTVTAFHNRRYESVFRKVCETIASGVLGKITHIRLSWGGFGRRWDWQTLTEFGGGQLNNNCPHAIDQSLHLLTAAGVTNYDALTLTTDLKTTVASGDAEDHVRITLHDPKTKITLDIELFATQAYPQDRWMVCGTLGGLRGDTNTIEWKWLDPATLASHAPDKHSYPDRSYCREELVWQTDSFTATDGFGEWQESFYKDLHATIRKGKPSVISVESAKEVTKMLERVRTNK
jgi:scyllo-inositol 2-dehydrogenase (NADP+)